MQLAPEQDRRKRRSDDPLIALHYQLTHTKKGADLEAIVVADDSGTVMAGAGSWALCEELAAYAPLLAGANDLRESARLDTLRSHVSTLSVPLRGLSDRVFLCAQGAKQPAAPELLLAAEGVSRILGTAA